MLVVVTCVVESVAAVGVLATGHSAQWQSNQLLPLSGVTISLTPLGALFVVLVALVAVPATLYWIGYAPHGMSARITSSSFAMFVTSLLLVPAAASVSTFMFLWEMMALGSLALVLTDQGRRAAARSAGVWYGVITHVGAAFILAAFLVLDAHAGSQSFAALESHARALAPGARAAIFLLALVGFGSKAGVVPFHVWLPRAHPEAPSPVSALMSGAMVALGVYGIVLFGNVLLGGGPVWWWLIVLTLGALSALFGSLHAANSTDLKRLLAYSTTDNIGLVLLAVGASGLFVATGHARLGALSLVAALFILVNHAMFKGALFLAAGSVQVATGTRDLDEMGGLLRRMPQTGALFLVAAASICALPPFNGFVGEWLLFQSLLHGANLGNTSDDIAIPVAVAALALTAGLTIVAFVKATGIGFLGRPRSTGADGAVEVASEHARGIGPARSHVCRRGSGAHDHPARRRASRACGAARRRLAARGARTAAPVGRCSRRAGADRLGRVARYRTGPRDDAAPFVGAPACGSGHRGVGLRTRARDSANAVHRHILRRTGAACL